MMDRVSLGFYLDPLISNSLRGDIKPASLFLEALV